MQILFYKGTKEENLNSTLWDNIICFVTRSRFSHVELSWTNDGYGNYICWSSSTRDNGVRFAKINTSSGHWVIIDIPTIPESKTKEMDGAKYDYIGLLSSVLKMKWFSSSNKWFCSEAVAEALSLPDSWSYTPEDLYKIFR